MLHREYNNSSKKDNEEEKKRGKIGQSGASSHCISSYFVAFMITDLKKGNAEEIVQSGAPKRAVLSFEENEKFLFILSRRVHLLTHIIIIIWEVIFMTQKTAAVNCESKSYKTDVEV